MGSFGMKPDEQKAMFIQNTLKLEDVYISEALLGQARSMDNVEVLSEPPTHFDARCFAPELDGDIGADALVCRNPREIHVEDLLSPHIPLEFLDVGLLFNGPVQLNQSRSMPNGCGEGIPGHTQADGFQLVTVKDRRDLPRIPQTPVASLPTRLSQFHNNSFGHLSTQCTKDKLFSRPPTAATLRWA